MKSRERERQARVACEEALTERTELTDQFAFPSFFPSMFPLLQTSYGTLPKKNDDEDLSLT